MAAALSGPNALLRGVLGLLVGGLLLLPFVLRSDFGLADALLLAASGAGQGWEFVLRPALWMAMARGVLAVIARRTGLPRLPYVPAIAVGVLLHS